MGEQDRLAVVMPGEKIGVVEVARGCKHGNCRGGIFEFLVQGLPLRASAFARQHFCSICGGEQGKAETMAVTFFRAANPLFSPQMRSRASVHPRAQRDCPEWAGGFVRGRPNHMSPRDR